MQDMTIWFLEPLRGDLLVRARVLDFGNQLVPVEVIRCDAQDRWVAVSRVTYVRRCEETNEL